MKRATSSHPTHNTAFSLIIWALVLSIFGLLAIGSLVLQKQLRQSQADLRGEASVANGPVHITMPATELSLGSESVIKLEVSTQQTQVSAIQLDLELKTTNTTHAFGTNFNYRVTNDRLKLADWNGAAIVSPTDPALVIGYRYQFLLIPTTPADPFRTQETEPLMALTFVPSSSDPYHLSFDPTRTISTNYLTSDEDVLTTIGTATFPVGTDECVYSYGEWSSCQNSKQIRTYTVSPSTCPAPEADKLEQSCLPQCSYTYSNWSECNNGWQTRTVSTTPSNCTWYEPGEVEEVSRSCGEEVVDTTEFTLYTYEACWYTKSQGSSAYIIWDKNAYPNVTAIDVSIFPDFRDFANKNVAGATSTLGDRYLVTDLTNFRTFSDGKQSLYAFYPEVNYYFRLYNQKHSGSVRFFIPKCAGVGGVSYKQCNESCTSNAECAPNLTCSNNQCRRAGNVESNLCVLPPDAGLNRTCNEYCADTRECASGYSCWYNRCRNPKNLNDISCRLPAKKTTYRVVRPNDTVVVDKGGTIVDKGADAASEASCNEACVSNRDCELGLRCFENHCRLPANLNSTVCSATELGERSSASSSSVTPTSTLAAKVTTKPSRSPSVPMVKTDSKTENDTQETTNTNWFVRLLPKLPLILGGIIILIVAILILPLLFRTSEKPMAYQRTTLADLEKQRQGNSAAGVSQSRANNGQPTPPSADANQMLERLKQRGVQPPGI